MIRVELPYHLQQLARVGREVEVDVVPPVTARRLIDALESRFPMLRGTIRDYATDQRRPFLRFFACEQDLSFDGLDTPLPEAIASGSETFMIVGALSGG